MKLASTFLLLLIIIAAFARGQDSLRQGPLKDLRGNKTARTNLTKYLNEKVWDSLFPNRNEKHNSAPNDFYSFQSFVTAAKVFPAFLSEGNEFAQKKELAAFLANIAQETSGGWADAPGGYFKWGLYFVKEKQDSTPIAYADTSKKNYPPVPGKYYFGRGPKQLSWNYNYGQFSEAWFGNKDSLLQNPDLLATDPVLSFASAIWFWMTPQRPKPSCHDIMAGKWQPTAIDSAGGRLPGFGATVNVINGGVECGSETILPKTNYRYQYYLYFCNYFHVAPGGNTNCTNQKPFGQ